MGGLLAAAACGTRGASSLAPATTRPLGDALPVRGDFAIPAGQTWLNSAFIHPVPTAAASAVRSYLETRTFREPRLRSGDSLAAEVKAEFAALINAKPAEVSLVQSTSAAENLVVSGLGIPGGRLSAECAGSLRCRQVGRHHRRCRRRCGGRHAQWHPCR